VVLLQVRSTSNNAKGDKRVMCFRYSFVAMVILILSYKHGISLHVPLPMNIVNARYHNLLSASDFLPICCSAREIQYMIWISRVTCSTDTNFSRDL